MRLKDKARPSVPPIEAGVYFAVCTIVADLGDQYSDKYKNVNRQLVLGFDIPSETVEIDGEQKPRQLSRRFTFSYTKKSNLFKTLSGWLGITSEDEIADFDLFELAGKGCQVQVTVNENNKNNVNALLALPRGVPAPVSSNPIVTYDVDEDGFDGQRWDALPEWIRNAVMQSEQYKEFAPDQLLDMPAENASAGPEPAEKKRCPI